MWGGGARRSDDEAAFFLQRATSLGDRAATTVMGSLYQAGRGAAGGSPGEPYSEGAAALWAQASRAGDELAGLKHASLLLAGVPEAGLAPDPRRAAGWIRCDCAWRERERERGGGGKRARGAAAAATERRRVGEEC